MNIKVFRFAACALPWEIEEKLDLMRFEGYEIIGWFVEDTFYGEKLYVKYK